MASSFENTREGKALLRHPVAHNRKAGHASSLRKLQVRATRRARRRNAKRRLNG